MKQKLFTLFLALIASVNMLFAESGTCGDNLTWDLTDSVLTISGTGDMYDYLRGGSPWYEYKESVTNIVINSGVTSIGNYAFYNCTGLASVTIPDNVISIGSGAFYNCTGLTSVEIPNSVTSIGSGAFDRCWSLTSITIPNSVTSIEEYAFYGCEGLTSVELPNSVTSIGKWAFSGCSGLTSIEIPNSVTSIGEWAFVGCTGLHKILYTGSLEEWCLKTWSPSVISSQYDLYIQNVKLTDLVIPDSITSIGESAFSGCTSLASVTIPNSVTDIGRNAFVGCTGFTSVTLNSNAIVSKDYTNASSSSIKYIFDSQVTEYIIGDSVTSIGNYAFYRYASLISVTILNSVTRIGNYAFAGCAGLTSVTIPNSVTSLGDGAFNGCYSLTSVEIPNSVTSIGNSAFNNCTGLASITIPNSVTSIGDYAFFDCSSLTSVTIPNSVTSIGNGAFLRCNSLASPILNSHVFAYMPSSYSGAYTIPDGIESIAGNAFEGCYSLTSITIPNSVTSIGKDAFYGCSGLTSVTIPNSVTSIGNGAFFFCTSLTSITIPNSVTSIGEDVFEWCFQLTDIYVECGDLERIKQLLNNDSRVKYPPLYIVKTRAKHGTITSTVVTVCDNDHHITCSANPDYGYHFAQWSNGDTNNPRIIELTQDTLLEAEFAINQYSLTVSCDETLGHVNGENGEFDYLTKHVYEAVANKNYHFVQWSDGVIDNPRTITLTQDTTIEAIFAIDQYLITVTCENSQGTIEGETGEVDYLSEVTYTAVPAYGYHFDHWIDTTYIEVDFSAVLTASQAYTLASQLESNQVSDEIYTIHGYVRNLYGNYRNSYYIADTPEGEANFLIFKADTPSNIGDHVIVSGHITNYRGTTPETTSGASLHVLSPEGTYLNVTTTNTNPHTIKVERDMWIRAEFAINQYQINGNTNGYGSVSGTGSFDYLSERTIQANPDYGYHFTQWSDGNTNNPRTFVLTQDTTFTAEFAINQYSIQVSCDEIFGHIEGDNGEFDYLTNHIYEAVANYGYHFVRWSDGNTSNPYTVTLKGNIELTAIFAKNVYTVSGQSNQEKGHIEGLGEYEYLDAVELSVVSEYGYHFTQWSDGNTDNPRTIVLAQDTTITAEFAVDKSGTCGKDNVLTWSYDDQSKTLTITGNGELTENYTFGLEAPTQMNTLIISDGVTAIGERAFYGKTILQNVVIGSNVTSIGNYAFADINNRQLTSLVMPAELLSIGDYAFSGNTYIESIDFNAKLQSIGAYAFQDCYRVSEMTCLAVVTPDLGTDALTSINSYASLCVPAECLKKYKVDPNWGRFDLCELGSIETTTDTKSVTVEPADNTALFTWPIDDDAASYSLQITKDGEVFCTLVFNSNGQLTGIAFAPSRNGAAYAQAVTMSVSAMSFTVTGLNSASKYGYRMSVTDESQNEIQAYSGEFATTGYEGEVNQGGEPEINTEGIDDIFSTEKVHKILRDGQIYILRGDKVYTLTGQEVR